MIKVELRKGGAEFPEELDPIEEQIKKYEQLERLRETVESRGIPPSLMKDLVLPLPEFLKMIQQIQGGDSPISDDQAGPPLEAPIDIQEGRGSGLGQVSPDFAPTPEGVDYGTLEKPQPPTHPGRETRPGDYAPEKLLSSQFDWAELEKGAHGDPGEFIRGVCRSAYEQDSQYHHQLARLFQDNEPEVILAELSRLAESMAVVEGEDCEVAVSVVNHLRQTEAGQLWLAQVNVAAKVI